MVSSEIDRCWKLGLAISLAIGALSNTSHDGALAQIEPDGTLGAENSQITSKSPGAFQIDGGATRRTNLFHSFAQFSLPTNGIAYFNNALSIQNIISRVTGSSVSNIDGILQANGTANLFLINPNGIIFGQHASLKIRGSFVVTTASSLNFADGTKFSATDSQTTPLLTVSAPIGLQFGGTAGSITNQSSTADSSGKIVGLQVQPGNTLALVGSNVALEGGNLTVAGGRIELGSVAGPSMVSLTPTNQGLRLGYEGVQNFRDIQLSRKAKIDTSGTPSGTIQVQGRHVILTDAEMFANNQGSEPGGSLAVTASESVELIGPEALLQTQTGGAGAAGEITITTGKLIVQNGSQLATATNNKGSGGQLTVNASDSVELIGTSPLNVPSTLASLTAGTGPAGNININTKTLLIQAGAVVSAESTFQNNKGFGLTTLATGQGGAITVNASDSVELTGTDVNGNSSSLLADTQGAGNAGDITVTTGKFLVQNGAQTSVSSSEGTGAAGNLQVHAPSILLDNQGNLNATVAAGDRGNITLYTQDLRLRHNSSITTDASSNANGGNINIATGTLVALEKSDITANARGGQGGNIQITTQGLFRSPDSQITAISELGAQFSGTVQINTLVNNPSQGVVTLPIKPVDVTGQIAQGCPAGVGPRASKFVVTGRGGLPPDPTEALRSEPTLADLGPTVQSRENRTSAATSSNPSSSNSPPLVEAQGWMTNAKGEVVLVAQVPTATLHIPWLAPTICQATKTAS